MSKAGINRNLSNNAFNAAEQANNPGGANVYATLADLFQQDGLIDGSAVWSGSGFIYDVTNLLYRIGGVLYTATATQVTLTAADPTNGRRDLIVVNTAQVVSVKTGVPAPAPVAPALDVDEVLVAEIFVGAGTTAPVITIEALYDENAGSPTEWVGTSDDLNVTFASVADPNTGTVSIETTAPLGSNKYIQLAKGSPYTIVSGSVDFYIKAKQTMSTPSGQLYIGFYVGGSLVGNSIYIGGSPTNIYGFDPTDTSAYQLVSIPITAFGVLPTTVDAIRFFKGPGSTTAEFFLDNVEIQEGAVAPPVAPSLPSLTELSDWVGDSSNTAVERKSSIQPIFTGTAPNATFDETQGYQRGSIVYDSTDVLVGPTIWICFSASPGAAIWKKVNNEILKYWESIAFPADVGFTWAGLPVSLTPGNGSTLRFVEGANISLEQDTSQNAIRFTATGPHVIEDEGTPLTQRPTIDFQGAGVTVTDDAGNNQTVVTIPGGGGGSGVNWIPMFSGGLFATNQTFYSNWEEATGIQNNVETPFPAGTLNAFKINCNSNSANNPTVIDVMRGASVLISVTIPGLTTGVFEATGSVAIANNDLLSIRVTIPAGGPSIGLRGGLLSITV